MVVDLREYSRIFRRRWLLILGTVTVCVAASVGLTMWQVPQYASDSRVFFSSPAQDSSGAYQGGLFSQQRAQSYAQVVDSRKVSQEVVDELGLPISAQQLSTEISAAVDPDTVLLEVTVTDPDARQAQRVNEALLQQMQAMVTRIETPPGKNRPLLRMTVVDPPQLPDSPVSPKPALNVTLALLLGLLLGFSAAVLREVFDASVKDPRGIRELARVPVLADVPVEKRFRRRPLIGGDCHSPGADAFGVLRTNLQFIGLSGTGNVFTVASSASKEGRSTTAVNLAVALARAHKRVLLLDADLRRPQIGRLLGLDAQVGLTNVLLGQFDVGSAVQSHEESGLQVITSGEFQPNPAELLQGERLSGLLRELRERYDAIIVDSPPLLPATDAALVASEADGVLVVVRHGSTTKDQLVGGMERLQQVNAPVLGIVLNMVPVKGRASSIRDDAAGAPQPSYGSRDASMREREDQAVGTR